MTSGVKEMLGFFSRKDVRKILKRKDSDAGDRGRALEELRASVFSKLRSFGGAKRQQQSLLGPSVALTFNFFVSVSIILMNKLVLVNVGFNYPIFLTFIHYIFSWLIMALLKALSILSLSSPSKTTKYSSLLSLGIVMSLSTGILGAATALVGMSFYTYLNLQSQQSAKISSRQPPFSISKSKLGKENGESHDGGGGDECV
ncbi:nucleotide-sugar uncharacterized transporter 1-like [Olea europaea var. sylvestris]|uniref:nucleotide-sugar uncharacterized transporter 1-like n=1 Tax=Olea europaea var. sylvestris TaxID=158386 RepID=UPI000C1D615B|nr:nucleotide-sugar uncharacterized transporter 1-like [Olea europaea var. sylvestris]